MKILISFYQIGNCLNNHISNCFILLGSLGFHLS